MLEHSGLVSGLCTTTHSEWKTWCSLHSCKWKNDLSGTNPVSSHIPNHADFPGVQNGFRAGKKKRQRNKMNRIVQIKKWLRYVACFPFRISCSPFLSASHSFKRKMVLMDTCVQCLTNKILAARIYDEYKAIKHWKFDAPPALAITKLVSEFIIRDCQHPFVVEGDGFGRLIRLLEPRYVVPNRTDILKASNHFLCSVLIASLVCFCCTTFCKHSFLLCITKLNRFSSNLCIMIFLKAVKQLPHPLFPPFLPVLRVRSLFLVLILFIVSHSPLMDGLVLITNRIFVSLRNGSICLGKCVTLCLTFGCALIDIQVTIWKNGFSKFCKITISALVWYSLTGWWSFLS